MPLQTGAASRRWLWVVRGAAVVAAVPLFGLPLVAGRDLLFWYLSVPLAALVPHILILWRLQGSTKGGLAMAAGCGTAAFLFAVLAVVLLTQKEGIWSPEATVVAVFAFTQAVLALSAIKTFHSMGR